ncbi:MAG: DUF5711 family protein [Lachnospiraceae bacterium]|nr:DUF5711 family protein [Lachnospiraceae bacterium]
MGRSENYNEQTEYDEQGGKRKKNTPAIVILIICILGSVALLIYHNLREKGSYVHEIISTQEVLSQNRYCRYGEGYIKYNTDGAEAYKDGKAIWNVSYDMNKPMVDVCGDYAAFADKGMQTVVITDGIGGNYSFNIPEKIVGISVASQGVTAVWTDSLSKDHIYVYDINGVLLLEIETSIATDGFPLSIDISEDGKKLVTSYMKISDDITSWVTFYNFGSVGQNYAGRVVGSYSFKGEIIPEVRFVNNERVCAFGEKNCILYRMKELPTELAIQEAPRLSGVCSDDESICLAESETDGTTKITVFDTDGKSKKTIVTGMTYSGMCVEGEELIVFNNSSMIIYYLNGNEKYRTPFDGGIRDIYPSGTDRYTVVGGSEVRLLQLEHDESEE